MRIQLRQIEIEEALQQYIANQGINLTGKVVEIGFTASRSADGLTADVDITNVADSAKPVQVIPREVKTETQVTEQPAAPAEEATAQEEQAPEAQAEEAQAKDVAPASSLFS